MEQGLQRIKREANLAACAEQVRACRSSGIKVSVNSVRVPEMSPLCRNLERSLGARP